MKSSHLSWLVVALVAAPMITACGEDDPPPPPPPPAGGPAPAPAPGRPAAPPPGGQLQPRVQIEQKIICPEIEKATGTACEPGAPMCDPGLYCLPVTAGGNFCEPCTERDTIRHEFKDRDFVADQVRDPFQSYVIVPTDLVEKSDKKPEGPCTRKDQFVATNYSYMDLRLVGIVSQGTQRKVLMMDRGNLGHIIRRGDCVGKEKAVVKDIGAGYVTFVVQADDNGRTPVSAPEEHSVQLHPKSLEVADQPDVDTGTTSAPIVEPPGGKSDKSDKGGTTDKGTDKPAPAPTPPPAPAPKASGSDAPK